MAILAVVLLLGAYLVVADVEEAEAADYGIKDVGLKDADQYEILIVTFDIAYPTNLSFTITHDEDGKSVQDYSGTFTQTGQKEQRLVRASYGLSEDVEYTLTVYAPGAELTRQFSLPEAYVAQVIYFVDDVKYGSEFVHVGDLVTEPADPEVPGETFVGWFTADGEEFDFDMPLLADVRLYAAFGEGEEYAIEIDDSIIGGTVIVPSTSYFGVPVAIVAEPDLGYELVSYYVFEADGTEVPVSEAGIFAMPASDVTVGAVFEEIPAGEYSVKVYYGAVLIVSETAAEGKEMSIDVSRYIEAAEVEVAGPEGLEFQFDDGVLTFVMPGYDVEFAIVDVMYDVTFYVGEEEYDSQVVVSGECAYAPEDPVLAGAVFMGWYLTGADEPFDFDTPITQDLDLYALMEPFVQTFDVEFYVNGGVYRTITVDYGDTVEEIDAPEIPGKTFKGWFLQGAAEPFDFDTPITQDLDLYAKYEDAPVGEEHTVTFYVGDEVFDIQTVKDGELAKELYPPYYPGQQFEGWYEMGSEVPFDFKTPITHDYELYAFYEDVGFTVTFYVDGAEYDKQTVEAGGYAVEPADPVKAGAVFMGWFEPGAIAPFDFETPITQDVALNALFEPFLEEFTVTFYVDVNVYDEQTVPFGGFAIEPEDPVLAGATFIGWFLEGAGEPFDFETPITQDLDLHALFEPFVEEFTVTFYVGEEIYAEQAVPMGGFAIEPEDPVLLGAEFVGWYTVEGELFDFETPITEDLVLIAEFEPLVETFEVTFYVDDEVYDYQTVAVGDVADEPEDPVIAGAAFLGWFLEGAIAPFDFATPITQDLDLHALFEPVVEEFTVTFYVNGEVYDVQTVAYNGLAVEPDAPSIEGSEFLGWFLVGAIVPFDFETPITQDLDLYAEFVAYSETVTVSLNQIGSVIYITVTAEDDGAVVKSGEMEIQYTYLVSKMSFGKERLIVMTSPVIKVDIEGGETIAAVEYDLGSEEYLSTISTVWATYTADGIDSEKSAPIIFESVDNAAFLAAKE